MIMFHHRRDVPNPDGINSKEFRHFDFTRALAYACRPSLSRPGSRRERSIPPVTSIPRSQLQRENCSWAQTGKPNFSTIEDKSANPFDGVLTRDTPRTDVVDFKKNQFILQLSPGRPILIAVNGANGAARWHCRLVDLQKTTVVADPFCLTSPCLRKSQSEHAAARH